MDRTVITFRAAPEGPEPLAAGARRYVERARELHVHAVARGAEMIGWGAQRITFAADDPTLEVVIALAQAERARTRAGETPWSIGIAEGPLEPFGAGGAPAGLAWGPPLVTASLLASFARPGEVLCAETVAALRSGRVLAHGTRGARDGKLRVRGARIDLRAPWTALARAELGRIRVPPSVGHDRERERLVLSPGSLSVIRADPGAGGTRMVRELAERTPRALVVSPSGSGFEPLGALRRAFARAPLPLGEGLGELLRRLDSGGGLPIDVAARLLVASAGALFLDDVKAIDPATLEACVRAASSAPVAVVVRLDATGSPPSILGGLTKVSEIELSPLSLEVAEELAAGCTTHVLDVVARRRWARVSGGMPLAVVESVAWGLVTGELAVDGNEARPRARTSGRGKALPAAEWIKRRAESEAGDGRELLCLMGLLGGEASTSRVIRILEAAGRRVDVPSVVSDLVASRWLATDADGNMALPSRTHLTVCRELLDDETRSALHRAAADVIEEEEGTFGKAEAAWHATRAGDIARGARMFLAAARASAAAGYESSTTHLIAFARRTDPSCEEQALELLANALAHTHSLAPAVPPSTPSLKVLPPPPAPSRPKEAAPPPAPARRPSAPAPPASAQSVALPPIVVPPPPPRIPPPPATSPYGVMPVDRTAPVPPPPPRAPPPAVAASDAPDDLSDTAEVPALRPSVPSPEPPPSSQAGANIASRLGELAKEALLSGDNVSLERWAASLQAAGESPVFTERMRAMARIVRGDIGDALRVLRRTRAELEPTDLALRCQTSLALGIALSVAGRPQDALLEGLDALARARQTNDARAATACLAFLAKLFQSVGRHEEAVRLRQLAP